jgi:hypothetical protein
LARDSLTTARPLWRSGGGGYDSVGAEEGIAKEEEGAENPDERADFAVAAATEYDEGEGEEAEAEAGGEAEVTELLASC